MSSILVLVDAIEALIPADLNAFTDAVKLNERDQAPESALPWVVLRVNLPTTLSRSLAGTRTGQTVTITATIAGITATSVRVVYQRLNATLEQTTPRAAGWNTSPIREINVRPIAEDRDITLIESNRHPVYKTVEWTLTVSPK